jgi:D-serine deaminase-like pyridoxal phosphate-dependent protein
VDPVRRYLEETRDRVRRQYGADIGRRREELITPALVLDLPAARRNIDAMARRLAAMPAVLRPHVKVHKSPELARYQVDAGAVGVCVATVWEALAFFHSGFDHVLIANTVAHPLKVLEVARLARDADVMVAVDDAANAEALSSAAVGQGTSVGVLLEVDTGMDRAGVDTIDEALAVARRVVELPGLRFLGVTGYEGHCSLTPEHDVRLSKQRAAMDFLVEVAEQLEADGIPCPIRSAGGTATWAWTAVHPGISEIQAGTYVVIDNFHRPMADGFEHSLTVQASVISRTPNRVVVDAGSKSVGAGDLTTIVGQPYRALRFDEEHGIYVGDAGCELRVGDSVALVPGYSPSTVNWHDAFHVVENDVVVDVWPVVSRGPGHHGMVSREAR